VRGTVLGRGTAIAVTGVSVSIFGFILMQFGALIQPGLGVPLYALFAFLAGLLGMGLGFLGVIDEFDEERGPGGT
jgi:hypothetical protein